LLLPIGLLDQIRDQQEDLTEHERASLRIKIADQAVIHPENAPQEMRDISHDAGTIRAALEAVERGDEAAAQDLLRAIPRQSLLADWKFFVRGLIAYYRRDAANMQANWSRLDPKRAASTIAAPLQLVQNGASHEEDERVVAKVNRLEKHLTSHPVLNVLLKLQKSVVGQDWLQAVRALQSFHSEFRKLDPKTYQRVVVWLSDLLIEDGRIAELDR
jgi:hypothetical protein